MNIQSSFDPAQPVQSAQGVRSGPAAASPAPSHTGQPIADGDTASISPAAVAAAAGDSDVRTGKVAAVQQALASGTYAVSAFDVAGKLIDHLLS